MGRHADLFYSPSPEALQRAVERIRAQEAADKRADEITYLIGLVGDVRRLAGAVSAGG